ncbi:MAG: hypothetical protein Q4B32_08715 [Clostridia bacterium]|nr:hypothetical protein [Clostridia bacterium]
MQYPDPQHEREPKYTSPYPKPNYKNPLPFLSPKPPKRQPTTRVHTAETTINGKTYETTTIETPYGSTTTTKEKKPKTAKQLERDRKFTFIILIVYNVCLVIFMILAYLRKRGIV